MPNSHAHIYLCKYIYLWIIFTHVSKRIFTLRSHVINILLCKLIYTHNIQYTDQFVFGSSQVQTNNFTEKENVSILPLQRPCTWTFTWTKLYGLEKDFVLGGVILLRKPLLMTSGYRTSAWQKGSSTFFVKTFVQVCRPMPHLCANHWNWITRLLSQFIG